MRLELRKNHETVGSREVSRTEVDLQFRQRKPLAEPDSGKPSRQTELVCPGIDEPRLFEAFALNGTPRIVRIRLPFPAPITVAGVSHAG